MNILALKLILAPLIIGGASLAGRKWGHTVSGWLIGLPLTSGPVAFFVALSHDKKFLASTVLGTLSGGFPLVAFTLAYAWLSVRFKWPVALIGSLLAYFAVTLLLQNVSIPLWPLFGLVILAIVAGMVLLPRAGETTTAESQPGRWDIPGRILLGTSFILLVTGIAPFIGPRLTGLLSTIPLYTAILTVFAHRQQGVAGVIGILRGLLLGLFAFAGFYLALALLLPVGLGLAFGAAIVSALLVQGGTLLFMRWEQRQSKEQL
jgi:hypothetical protein